MDAAAAWFAHILRISLVREGKIMRRMICLISLLTAASLMLVSCGGPAANNAGNKPANAGNSANNAAAAPAPNAAALEADLKKMTTDMAASLLKNDVAAMEKMYAENYQFVGPDGAVSNKTQRLDAMKSGDTKYESITFDDISVRTNPEGTGAIVISKGTVKGKNMGRKADGQYRVSHVWSKTKDGWQLVNGQTTPLAAATNAAKADDSKPVNSNTTANGAKPPPPANR